jgi:hypothetical protein
LQQQQSGEVLQALQSCKSGQLQPGASQQLSGILSEDWFETRSMFSEAFSLERQLSEQLLAAQQQAIMPAPAPALQLQQAGPWVPETPLLFAGERLAGFCNFSYKAGIYCMACVLCRYRFKKMWVACFSTLALASAACMQPLLVDLHDNMCTAAMAMLLLFALQSQAYALSQCQQ